MLLGLECRRIPVGTLIFERQVVGFGLDGAEQDEVRIHAPIVDNGMAKPRRSTTSGDEPAVMHHSNLSNRFPVHLEPLAARRTVAKV